MTDYEKYNRIDKTELIEECHDLLACTEFFSIEDRAEALAEFIIEKIKQHKKTSIYKRFEE